MTEPQTAEGGRRRAAGRALTRVAALTAVIASTVAANAAASAISLSLPQGSAFAVLGHSCGGIQEQSFTTGYSSSGRPTGDVYLQTRCAGSGRGGPTTTYTAWAAVNWTFSGAVASYTVLAGAPGGLSPTFSAGDAHGDTVYNVLSTINIDPSQCTVGDTTYCFYRAYATGTPPAAATAVTATQVADSFMVTWTPDPVTAPVLTSSTLTATPVSSSAPVLTATVNGTTRNGKIPGLAPSTTYQITVVNNDAGGVGAASSPITVSSQAATTLPSPPTGLTAGWTYSGTIQATWKAASPGNSPIDQYEATATPYGGDPPTPAPVSQTVSGSTLSAILAVDATYDWSVQVRGHNAAGWGPWSSVVMVPALN